MAVIIDELVNKLKDAAYDEIKFQLGINEEVEEIANRLKAFKGLVEYTSQRKQETMLAEERVKQLRETAFYIEDVLEEFMLEMELLDINKPSNFCGVKNMGALMLYHIKKAYLQFQFHHQLNDIKRKLEFQQGEQEKYQALTVEGEDESRPHVGSHRRMENVEIVGMEDEVAELRDLVEQPRDHMLLITVWGPGGSGKTTLVQKVYERVQMNRNIDCHAWVYVGQWCSLLEILRATMKGFSRSAGVEVPNEVDLMGENDLRESISKILKQKRYVLILDDVWDSEILKKFGFPTEKMSSIIITSRQKTIALGSFLGVQQTVVEVQPLNPNISWELFCKVAFQRNIPRDNQIETLGRELVRRCDGLPVAILAIGQLMATKGNESEKWNDVLQDLDYELQGDLAELNRVLLLSYYHLPTHLKHCFLYCAMFPKSVPVSIRKLIRLWIAEGFVVKEEGRRTLEKIARGYFDELMNRSLLQFRYESKGFQMHDLLRDVAVHMIAKENFGVLLNRDTELETNQRRLAIHALAPNAQLDSCKLKLRSLLASCGDGFCSSFSQMFQNIKLIRTLDLEGAMEINNVPDQVGDLISLRYLGLGWIRIQNLPESVKNLHHLETLDVRGNRMKRLVAGITELKQLRHLLVNDFDILKRYLKLSDGSFLKFTQLQSLDGIHLNFNQAKELGFTTQLTKLNISATGEESWREIYVAIGKMRNLRTLNLRPAPRTRETLKLENLSVPPYLEKLALVAIAGLPDSVVSGHECLREIRLQSGVLSEQAFVALGQLPRLEILKLVHAYKGKQLVCEPNNFPRLKEFMISYAKNLTTWNQIPKGSMKWLRELTIERCNSLKMLPDGLQWLENLQKLCLPFMPQEFIERTNIGGTDHSKIQHIPRILLRPGMPLDNIIGQYYRRAGYKMSLK